MRAFGKSMRLVLELVFAQDVESRMQQVMVLTDGRTLTEITGPELFSRLMRRATRRIRALTQGRGARCVWPVRCWGGGIGPPGSVCAPSSVDG